MIPVSESQIGFAESREVPPTSFWENDEFDQPGLLIVDDSGGAGRRRIVLG